MANFSKKLPSIDELRTVEELVDLFKDAADIQTATDVAIEMCRKAIYDAGLVSITVPITIDSYPLGLTISTDEEKQRLYVTDKTSKKFIASQKKYEEKVADWDQARKAWANMSQSIQYQGVTYTRTKNKNKYGATVYEDSNKKELNLPLYRHRFKKAESSKKASWQTIEEYYVFTASWRELYSNRNKDQLTIITAVLKGAKALSNLSSISNLINFYETSLVLGANTFHNEFKNNPGKLDGKPESTKESNEDM